MPARRTGADPCRDWYNTGMRRRGQALAEYAIVLALTSSAAWARHAVDGVDARTAAVVLVAGVALFFVLSGRR